MWPGTEEQLGHDLVGQPLPRHRSTTANHNSNGKQNIGIPFIVGVAIAAILIWATWESPDAAGPGRRPPDRQRPGRANR
jgi:hypothetical protein